MAANLNKVQIGRIVHFAVAKHSPDRTEGCCNASLVVKVHAGENGSCNLAVFDSSAGVTGRTSVVRDAAGGIGTWHWPNECPDNAGEVKEHAGLST